MLKSAAPRITRRWQTAALRVLPLLTGGLIATALVTFGPAVAGGVLAVVVLPWLLSVPMRLYVLLLVTWPFATLYVVIRLPAGVPDLRYERIVVLALVSALLLGMLVARRPITGLPTWVVILATLQVVWYFYHTAVSGLADAGLSILISSTALPISLYWLTRVLITDRQALRTLLKALVVVGVIAAFSGFYERLLDSSFSPFPVDTGTASGKRYLDVPRGRAAGVFGNPAIYGAVLGVSLLSVGALYVEVRRRRVYVFAGVILAYGIFVSYTRSAWLAVVAAVLAAFLVTSDVMRQVRRTLAAALVGGIILVMFLPVVIGQNDELRDRVLETDNIEGRFDRAIYSWNLFLTDPLTGAGPDSLDRSIAAEFASEGLGFSSSHNTYLTLLVDGGAAVFIATMAVLGGFVARAIRVYRTTASQSPARYTLAAMLGTIVIIVASGLAIELKYFAFVNSLYWIAGATIANLGEIRDADPSFGGVATAGGRAV